MSNTKRQKVGDGNEKIFQSIIDLPWIGHTTGSLDATSLKSVLNTNEKKVLLK